MLLQSLLRPVLTPLMRGQWLAAYFGVTLPTPVVDYNALLLEDGTYYLVLEDGAFKLLLES